jgi:predicted XRE-type DNA-binding protein
MKATPKFEVSRGNVFADLGLPHAEELLAKADLAYEISRTIEERGLTQAQAARLLGIDQPKISSLVRGRLTGFSMERLYRYLNALGKDIEIVVRSAPARKQARKPLRVLTLDRRVAVRKRAAGERRMVAAKKSKAAR